MNPTWRILVLALSFASFTGLTYAQNPTTSPSAKECGVPVVDPVDVKPKISAKPEPNFTKSERERYRGYVITLRAILCGSGEVTDIVVTHGLTRDMDAAAIAAARLIKFTPAEKDGQKVSRPVVLKYIVKD